MKQVSLIEHSIYFVPSRNMICDKYLEDQGIIGDVTVGEFHLDLIPLDDDLISLELNGSFRSLYLDKDSTIIQLLSNALMKFQIIYGFFPRILGKGDAAYMLTECLDRARLDYMINMNSGLESKDSEFDSILLLDRTVDLHTPMRTQLTYEGLLDELYTINSSFVELDATLCASKGTLSSTKSKKIILNGYDHVFSSIRDQSFEMVAEVLNKIALTLQEQEESRHHLSTSSELKEFASKLGSLTANRQSLSIHQRIYERILKVASEPQTNKRWKLEESISARLTDSTFMDILEDQIMAGTAYTTVLKLASLYSVANGGIKPKLYDQFRRTFCHSYGTRHMFTLQNLETIGLLNPVNAVSKSNYSQLCKSLKLIKDYESSTENRDVSDCYAGYAPISVRLVQLASQLLNTNEGIFTTGGDTITNTAPLTWEGAADILALIPGKVVEKSIIPESKASRTTSNPLNNNRS